MPHGFITVGDVQVVALCDVVADFPRPLSTMLPDLPGERHEDFRARYPDLWNGDDTWRLHDHCYLVRSEGRVILVDTGIGPPGTAGERWLHAAGGLLGELAAAGATAEDVDTVVLTHCHLDHIGWNVDRSGGEPVPTFPRARYMVHRADWEAFPTRGDDNDLEAFEESIRPLETAGVLELPEEDRALTSSVRMAHAPGHTPGHVVVEIESGVDRALLSGDMANHPVLLTEPNWRYSGDWDPARASETRAALVDRVESRGETLCPAHFAEPFGRVRREGRLRFWSPHEPREKAS